MQDFAAFQTASLAAGFHEVLTREWPAGKETGEHSHPFDANALMVSGDLWLTCGGQTRHLRAGDRFELSAGTPHAERYGEQGATFWVARRNKAA